MKEKKLGVFYEQKLTWYFPIKNGKRKQDVLKKESTLKGATESAVDVFL